MYRIRHYNQVAHPDMFRGTWLGFLIRALNWARWKVELVVQRLVLEWLLRDTAANAITRKRVRRQFSLDVAQEALEKEQTSPLNPAASFVESLPEALPLRSERYVEGRANTSAAGHQPLDRLIATHGFGVRLSRYARGRRFAAQRDDGDFIPLEKETTT